MDQPEKRCELTRGFQRAHVQEFLDGWQRHGDMRWLRNVVEIIGEAASRVRRSSAPATPRCPGARQVGMRNRLIHGYDTVDMDILLDRITQQDLPPLIEQLEAIRSGGELSDGPN